MKNALIAAALAVFAALPARAADGPLDLGFAHTGMTLDEFRHVDWPSGSTVLCTGDAGLPESSAAVHFDVPKSLAQLGGTRCGLFQTGQDNPHPYGMDLGGVPAEIWAKFAPGRDGTPRLLQLVVKSRHGTFDAIANYFTDHLGPAETRSVGLARWEGNDADATIIDDGGKHLLAYLIDSHLQSTLNVRMSQHPRQRPQTQQENH